MPIEAGGGGILLFLDSDDTLEVNACEEVAKAFASDDIDLCIFKFKFLTEGIETLRDSFFDKSKTCSIDEFERFLLYEKWHNEDLFSLCNKAWKKEVYLRNFEENLKHIQQKLVMAEDALVSVSCLAYVKQLGFLDKILYCYHHNEHSATNQKVDLSKIALYLSNELFVAHFLKNLSQTPLKYHSIVVQIVFYNLLIYYYDLKKPTLSWLGRLWIKMIPRKMLKVKKQKFIESMRAKDVLDS